MNTITIRQAQLNLGRTVTLGVWIHAVRSQKTMQFVILRDHTGFLQMTVERASQPNVAHVIDSLTPESVVEVTGKIVANPSVRFQGIELLPITLSVISIAATPLPIAADSPMDQRLDWHFLDIRNPKKRLIFEIQTTAEQAMREFWIRNDFVEIHSPKLMGSPSESGAEIFKVPYFGTTAYLAQSPQFYKQMGIASGFPGVFEVGPVFRANPSFTNRHDTEFTSIDTEIAWIKSVEDVMSFEEQWLQYAFVQIAKCHQAVIKDLYDIDIHVPQIPFPRVTMAEAERIVSKKGHTLSLKGDLDPKGERLLAEYIKKTTGSEWVFVTEYPWSIRPFYHMRYEEYPQLTKSFDLLFKGVEVTTGAQREHRYDVLVQQAREKGLSLEPIKFYLEFFKYGCPPHGGYGFGLTRLLMMLLNLGNVREATYVYRGINRLTP